jgi:hypothetical protein
VAFHLLRRVIYFQGWTLSLVAAIFVAGWIVRGPSLARGVRRVATALCATLLVLAAAYVVSPQDIGWHIDNSFDRLVLQAWGALVVVAFLSLARRPAVI